MATLLHWWPDGKNFCVAIFDKVKRMALESRADSGLPIAITSHGGQNGIARAGVNDELAAIKQRGGQPTARSANMILAERRSQLTSGVPVLHDALRGQIQHPAQGIIVCEGGLIFRDLPELAVQALDDVRRVYDFSESPRGIRKNVLKTGQFSSQLFSRRGGTACARFLRRSADFSRLPPV